MSTPELHRDDVLRRAQMTAIIQALGPKKGDAFLRAMAEALTDAVSISELIPIRGPSADVRQRRRVATEEAVETFRRELPTMLSVARRAGNGR